ncbi:MAG: 5-deoxy-glucuronate isomerase, partial [Marinomonas sp.]
HGYQSYYLNVMAGPSRNWIFHNDKDHEWIIERDKEILAKQKSA